MALFLLTLAGQAQYPPRPGFNGYQGWNPFFNPFAGPGGMLNGAANVVSAQGDVVVQQEQARVMREQAEQAKIDTKRKAFDEMMYEKANTPTFTENQAQNQAMLLRRYINDPTEQEVTSGKAMNAMLPFCNALAANGVQGPPVPVNQVLLRKINVRGGPSGGNVGPLKQGGRVDWPLMLRGPDQKKLDALLPTAVSQAITGDLDPQLFRTISKDLQAMSSKLKDQFRNEVIDAPTYMTGKRFCDSLDSAVQTLTQPGAGQLLNGTYTAKGGTVPELAYNMLSNGLQFAPANPGDANAYYSLHSAMAAYALAAQSSSGFQANLQATSQRALGYQSYQQK